MDKNKNGHLGPELMEALADLVFFHNLFNGKRWRHTSKMNPIPAKTYRELCVLGLAEHAEYAADMIEKTSIAFRWLVKLVLSYFSTEVYRVTQAGLDYWNSPNRPESNLEKAKREVFGR